MKKLPLLLAAALLPVLVAPFALAQGAGNGPKARLFAKYDTNKNGAIDGDEVAAVRQAFAAEPKGELARYDANANGKLDDAEIAEIKPPGTGGKKGGGKDGEKKGGGKKKDADAEKKPAPVATP